MKILSALFHSSQSVRYAFILSEADPIYDGSSDLTLSDMSFLCSGLVIVYKILNKEFRIFVGMDVGANVYAGLSATEAVVDHLDAGTELWVKLIEGADRAQIINPEDESVIGYINLVDIIATMKPEGMEELPTRQLEIHSSLEDYGFEVIYLGVYVTLRADLINFMEDDTYTVKWQYSTDGEEFIDIEDANELSYRYFTDENTVNYIWKVQVILTSP